MASVYDLILRRLVQGHPEQLLLLLFGPDAPTLVRTADTSLPQSERRADALLIVEAHGERFAVEVEVQAQPEAGFSRRLLDYAVRAHLREGLPVLPVVLYLLPEAEGAPPPYTFGCAGRRVLAFDFLVVRLWEVDFSLPALQTPALVALSVMERTAGPERATWAEARLRRDASLKDEERLDLLVVLGALAARRFGSQWLSQSLRSVMIDSPIWDELLAEKVAAKLDEKVAEKLGQEIAKDRARSLLKFSKARKLELPPEAEQRLAQLDSAVLERLLDLVITEPEAATKALLTAVSPEGH